MSKEVVDIEAEGEQQSSAWIEQTSSGKLKFGCKCYKCDVDTAVDVVALAFVRFKEQVKKLDEGG
ncbi:unnamed protein product [marine sediment metagenome]|uniref:Uncharacterized protein n=1 Tax=marine sediment metagenome TaxID=412755 RepID=X0XVX6_9ZZZZ